MKHLRTLLFSLLTLLFVFSCEEENPAPENYFVVQKDGARWEAETAPEIWLFDMEKYLPGIDSLTVTGRRAEGEVLMQIAFKGVGTYSIPDNGTAQYHDLKGGDIMNSFYANGNTREQGQVVITEWNPETKAIRGTFHFRARRVSYSSGPVDSSVPETFNFTAGEFQGTAKDIKFD